MKTAGVRAHGSTSTRADALRADPVGTRLVTRMRTKIRVPGGSLIEWFVLGPGDGFMVRCLLRTLADRAG